MKKCKNCGTVFGNSVHKHKVFCKDKCRISYRNRVAQENILRNRPKKTWICAECGREYFPTRFVPNRKYCSHSCALSANKRMFPYKKKYIPAYRICNLCGTSFLSLYKQQLYCSEKCGLKHWRKNRHKTYVNKIYNHTCPICSNSFCSSRSRAKYCSRQCNKKANKSRYVKRTSFVVHPDMEGEIWKDVVGWEGLYQVSNMGRVRSDIRRKHCCGSTYPGKLFKLTPGRKGYIIISLTSKEHNRQPKRNKVHRLVGVAFIPNPQNKPEINHKNLNKADNRVENLEWVTSDENREHFLSTKKKGLCYDVGVTLMNKYGRLNP